MNREILFRGKRVDDGEWFEGHYYQLGSQHYIRRDIHIREIDPSTIGQFTGRSDKNGRRIFEGDILYFLDAVDCSTESGYDWDEVVCRGEISWDEERLGLYLSNRESIEMDEVEFETSAVIGNIHENPELLNNQKQ